MCKCQSRLPFPPMAFSATRVDTILTEIGRLNPRAIIVDSIQTVYLDEIPSSAGSVTQVMLVAVSAPVGTHCLSLLGGMSYL